MGRSLFETAPLSLRREQLVDAAEGFEFQRIAGRVAEEHGRLFADLAGEADMRRDAEDDARGVQARCQSVPIIPLQHDAEMRNRYVMAVNRVRDRSRTGGGIQMRDDLVPS